MDWNVQLRQTIISGRSLCHISITFGAALGRGVEMVSGGSDNHISLHDRESSYAFFITHTTNSLVLLPWNCLMVTGGSHQSQSSWLQPGLSSQTEELWVMVANRRDADPISLQKQTKDNTCNWELKLWQANKHSEQIMALLTTRKNGCFTQHGHPLWLPTWSGALSTAKSSLCILLSPGPWILTALFSGVQHICRNRPGYRLRSARGVQSFRKTGNWDWGPACDAVLLLAGKWMQVQVAVERNCPPPSPQPCSGISLCSAFHFSFALFHWVDC